MTLSVFQSSVVNNSGDVQAGAEIEVVNEATGEPANLYSTRAGTVTTNPMFADADGFFRFYTDAGEYRITATIGVFSKTFRYVRIGDAGAKDSVEFLSASDAVNFLSIGDGPVISRGGNFMAYGGTANAITLTSSNTESLGTVQDGDKLRFKATATNTGSATVAIDGGTVLTCKTPTGVNLPAGFIRTDAFTEGEVDGANFVVSAAVVSSSPVIYDDLLKKDDVNFDLFGGLAANDDIGRGFATSATTCAFYLPLNSNVAPTSITVTGEFSVLNATSTLSSGITSITLGGTSNNKMCVVSVPITGGTVGEALTLRTSSSSSSIKVNF